MTERERKARREKRKENRLARMAYWETVRARHALKHGRRLGKPDRYVYVVKINIQKGGVWYLARNGRFYDKDLAEYLEHRILKFKTFESLRRSMRQISYNAYGYKVWAKKVINHLFH